MSCTVVRNNNSCAEAARELWNYNCHNVSAVSAFTWHECILEQAGENEDDLSAQPSEVGSDLQPTVIDAPDKSSKVASVCNGHQEVGEGQEEEEKESAKEQEILDRGKCKHVSIR